MIKLPRDRSDDNGNEIKPGREWFARASAGTGVALVEKELHNVSDNIYAHSEVKQALEELFCRKCAYCEIDISRADWDVEHFRPTGRVKERRDHPGYYWLAYKWANLYPSCVFCNRHRKARPRWGRSDLQYSGGKADQFPLQDESTRAMEPGDDLGAERRLLLDPCEDDPEKHLRYETDGQIYPRRKSRKGKESIRIFNLKETRLRDERLKIIKAVCELLEIKISLTRNGREEEAENIRGMINGNFLKDRFNFAGAARFVVKNPEVFGVEE